MIRELRIKEIGTDSEGPYVIFEYDDNSPYLIAEERGYRHTKNVRGRIGDTLKPRAELSMSAPIPASKVGKPIP